MSSMPRGERPLDEGDSPLLLFAGDLRQLRTNAGKPSYRDLSRRAHFSASTLSDAAGGRKLPGLDVTLAYVRACAGDEAAWERRWHDLAVAMAQSRTVEGPSPYVGLNPFTTEDADRFFGREALTRTLLDRLDRQRFLAVFGASGEGKSSLLRAGIAAKFENAVVCTPGPDPDAAIADALARNPDLLVVDQFEELFTLCEDEVQRTAFLDALLVAGCKKVIAVRSDFYPHCAQYPRLADALTDAQVLLGTMTPDELRRAITQPAATVGCTVETALLTTLVAEAAGRSGVLPLVSHALLETWHRRRGNTLTLAGYQSAGGIQGALAQSAEAAFATLDDSEQHLAKQLLLRLSADGTKRPVPRHEVVGEEVLDVLAGTRLITVDEHTVEVTHEALFQAWPRLRAWLDEDHEGLRTHRRLTDAARTWRELGQDTDSLYRSTRLAETTEWVARTQPELTGTEREFIGASKARERRRTRRLRWTAAGLAVMLVATAASAVVAVQQRREVERLGLISQSQQLAAASEALVVSDPKQSARKAAEAYRTYPTPEARSRVLSASASARGRKLDLLNAWSFGFGKDTIALMGPEGLAVHDTATLSLRTRWRPSMTGTVFSWATSPDGRTVAVCLHDGRIVLWSGPEADQVVLQRTGTRGGVAFSEDGRSLIVGGDVWDLATRQVRYSLPVGPINGPFDVADGRVLALVTGGAIALWDLETRQRTGGLQVQSGDITRVRLLPGGKLAAVATTEGQVQVRDLATGATVATPPAHTGVVNSLTLSADGSMLVSGGEDGRVHIWDVAHGTAITTVTINEPARSAQFSPDGGLAVLTPRALRFFPPGSVPRKAGYTVRALTVDDNGSILTLDDAGVIERRDSTLRTLQRVETGVPQIRPGRFSPDHRLVVTNGPLKVRDTNTGATVSEPAVAAGSSTTGIAFGEKQIAVVGSADPDAVWSLDRRSQPTFIGGDSSGPRTAVSFGKDDGQLVFAREDGEVLIRDGGVQNQNLALPRTHSAAVRALALSPSRKILATGGDDGLIALWDTTTWRKLGELRGHADAVAALEFSPDGNRLASGGNDRAVVVWDVREQTAWATLRGHNRGVTHLAWRPDGSQLVSAGADAIQVWGLDMAQALRMVEN
ncbi:WD40 repeat domain-containing protein [Lentzea sp. BCCO 10_0856]|uniref:WD40 repeat domain-containing protein n=1 Tax=Lentzea miocenica TaxID=3095431 RepID=A0ABU4TGC7_9PSEU|nr:WD40 repeat domain-containing protein [Lentzea sp. BCCO 10_0856]MDX8037251.1 WD40 repeat domain-containing protein [Lentzea sp. BCCO 10_0856]